MQFKTRVLT